MIPWSFAAELLIVEHSDLCEGVISVMSNQLGLHREIGSFSACVLFFLLPTELAEDS